MEGESTLREMAKGEAKSLLRKLDSGGRGVVFSFDSKPF